MQKIIHFFFFLALNFGCLWLSDFLMHGGPSSIWYQQLPRAPWTPPGWVFGVAWSLIMVCYAIYMTVLPNKNRKDYALYTCILGLCAFWNAVFFWWHQIAWALLVMFTLLVLVYVVTWVNHRRQGRFSWLMLPFCVWIALAITLNAYPVFVQ